VLKHATSTETTLAYRRKVRNEYFGGITAFILLMGLPVFILWKLGAI
jgi:hypothetical protein